MIKLKDLLIENDTKDRGGVLYSLGCEFLLCLGENSGKWHVPKGHIQKNETPLEGSVREFTEETQISLNGIPDLLHTWDSKGGTFHLFKLEGDTRVKPRLDHEHTDWGYFDVNDLPSPMNEELEKVIKEHHNIEESSGMIKLKPLLERVDYQDTASELIKQYGLRSKIKIGSGKNFGEYIPEKDIITLRPSYPNIKEFLMTILHEIGHAIDAKRIGVKKYIKKYTQAGTMAAYHGLDPHDDNKWEDKAENFAKRELHKWL